MADQRRPPIRPRTARRLGLRGPRPSGLIQPRRELTDEELADFQANWRSAQGGIIRVLDSAPADSVPALLSPGEAWISGGGSRWRRLFGKALGIAPENIHVVDDVREIRP